MARVEVLVEVRLLSDSPSMWCELLLIFDVLLK